MWLGCALQTGPRRRPGARVPGRRRGNIHRDLQFLYRADQWAVPEVQVTLKVGLPLGGGNTLAQDFAFTVSRTAEPTMTASVAGCPWARLPYERPVAGYVLPAGRYEARFEFSPAPDHAAAEKVLLTTAPGVVESRWADDRTLIVTLDLVSDADPAIFSANGVPVPGTVCLARLDPLVVAGREKTALACLEDPGSATAEPKLIALSLPLEAGKLAFDGQKTLLLEDVINVDIRYDTPQTVPIPWVVDTRTGEARCLEGPFASSQIGMLLGMYGWAADGRLVLPLTDESAVLVEVGSGGFACGDNPIIPPGMPGVGPFISSAVSPDGRKLAWLDLAYAPAGGTALMGLAVADTETGATVEDYPDAAEAVLYDGNTWETPPILWSPVGDIWLPPQETLPAAQFRELDKTGGVFAVREFLAPDGKPLQALAWTVHSGQEDWLANGRTVGYEVGGQDGSQKLVLVTASGRVPLALTGDGNYGSAAGAAFSPDGSLVAVQSGEKLFIFRCPSGEKVREVEGRYLGFARGGQLWLVVPGES